MFFRGNVLIVTLLSVFHILCWHIQKHPLRRGEEGGGEPSPGLQLIFMTSPVSFGSMEATDP